MGALLEDSFILHCQYFRCVLLLSKNYRLLLKQRVYSLHFKPHLLDFSLLLPNSDELLLKLLLQDLFPTCCQSSLLLDIFIQNLDVVPLLLIHTLAALQQLLELSYLPLQGMIGNPSLAALTVLIQQSLLKLFDPRFITLSFHVCLL